MVENARFFSRHSCIFSSITGIGDPVGFVE